MLGRTFLFWSCTVLSRDEVEPHYPPRDNNGRKSSLAILGCFGVGYFTLWATRLRYQIWENSPELWVRLRQTVGLGGEGAVIHHHIICHLIDQALT